VHYLDTAFQFIKTPFVRKNTIMCGYDGNQLTLCPSLSPYDYSHMEKEGMKLIR
jgi:hypothetical protein